MKDSVEKRHTMCFSLIVSKEESVNNVDVYIYCQ